MNKRTVALAVGIAAIGFVVVTVVGGNRGIIDLLRFADKGARHTQEERVVDLAEMRAADARLDERLTRLEQQQADEMSGAETGDNRR